MNTLSTTNFLTLSLKAKKKYLGGVGAQTGCSSTLAQIGMGWGV